MADRVVVITGASGGIGAALAKRLAPQGDRLVLVARREAALNEVAERCGANEVAAVIATVIETRRPDVYSRAGMAQMVLDFYGSLGRDP